MLSRSTLSGDIRSFIHNLLTGETSASTCKSSNHCTSPPSIRTRHIRKVLDPRILLFISFLAWFLHPTAKTPCSDNLLFTQHQVLATRVFERHLAIKTLCSGSWKATMEEGGKQVDFCHQNLVLLLCCLAFPGFSVHRATLSRVIGS